MDIMEKKRRWRFFFYALFVEKTFKIYVNLPA